MVYEISVWLCFIFCIAMTAAGILVLFRPKQERHQKSNKYLLYFLIQIYTFGYYALWSDLFFRIMFTETPEETNLDAIRGFFSVVGIPFLLVGLLMYVLWILSLIKKRRRSIIFAACFSLLTSVVLGFIIFKRFNLLLNGPQIYALLTLCTTFFAVGMLLFSPPRFLAKKTCFIFALFVSLPGIIHIPFLFQMVKNPFAELLFIFLFFAGFTVISIFFYSQTRSLPEKISKSDPFQQFINDYNITNRESQIIKLICLGKSNKEIADECFVTLQTIKDHTHRIYTKVDVKNRTQLSHIVRGESK